MNDALSPLEIARGYPIGLMARSFTGAPGPPVAPLAALQAAIKPALLRPPCLVSFSGGLDSSLVLAVATDVARRLHVAAPIPITWRFTDAARAEESDWQEAVVAELGLRDWTRVIADDELDWVGPVARPVLRRHGVKWPPNGFLHAPLLEHARGGSLLTGVGGDQILSGWWGAHLSGLLSGNRRPEVRDPLRVAFALSPPRLRSRWTSRASLQTAWLTPAAERESRRMHARDVLEEPVTWRAWVRHRAQRRELRLAQQHLKDLAADTDALVVSPLLEPAVCEAIARAGGRTGFPGRFSAIYRLFPGQLPDALASRRRKALFDEVFWREPSRALARSFDGGGIDRGLVDPEALREAWRQPQPSVRSALLLQQVWLSANGAPRP
jgi:hypothetical protein